MNRRSFLKGFFGAIVAATPTAITDPTAGFTTATEFAEWTIENDRLRYGPEEAGRRAALAMRRFAIAGLTCKTALAVSTLLARGACPVEVAAFTARQRAKLHALISEPLPTSVTMPEPEVP